MSYIYTIEMLTVPLRILNEMSRTSNAAGGQHNKMSLTSKYTFEIYFWYQKRTTRIALIKLLNTERIQKTNLQIQKTNEINHHN